MNRPTVAAPAPGDLREAPKPIPVRGRFYLRACPACGWVGSSEQCGSDVGDDSDVYCPACGEAGCEEDPSEEETARHGEAVMKRILAADAAIAARTAERDAAQALAERIAVASARRNLTLKAAAEAQTQALQARVEGLEADAARMREALKPFAKAGELFPPRAPDDFDQSVYMPAAGRDYALSGDHLRAARAALDAQPTEQEASDGR